jgi:dipeptidyl aminopeptidase/acylaminoacyl peptidase
MRPARLFAWAAWLALTAASALAAPLTIEEIVTMKRVVTATLSPVGDRIAYILDVPRKPYVDDGGASRRELHVVDLGGNARGYVTGNVSVNEVTWSADGRSLYYLSKRNDDEHVSLYRIPIDGGESERVYAHETDISGLELAPDGRSLAFRAVERPPESDDKLEAKGFNAVVYEESARSTRVWLLDLEVDEPEATLVDVPGSASALKWSPDGQRLVVALAPTPLIDDFYVSRQLAIVEPISARIVRRLDHAGKLGAFAWSPDGERIAFIGGEDRNDPLEGRVFIARADGEGVENLTPDYPGHFQDVAWRDADTLVYSAARGLWTEVGELDADAPFTAGTAPEGDPIVRSFDARPDIERLAIVADTPAHPDEVYVREADGALRRLTHSNPDLEDRELAVQEAVVYEARDGLEIEGILIRPLGERSGRRYPVVIGVHGGPESHYSYGWLSGYTLPAQAMAAEDFAFFFPNYRASTGRGIVFSKLDHRDPAGAEFDDLVDAKSHLVEIGLADPGRVGISGGSYGGYATMWASTALTEHFAAGVAFVGISDLIGSLGTSDIPNELYLVHLRRWPWDDWQFALERSPIYHADQARTPLLILGGDADPRVDPSQSLALYRNIKLRTETPVRLVRYPGEGHGNASTAARLDYALRMRRWMTHYLAGPGGEPPPHRLDHPERLAAAEKAAGDGDGAPAGSESGLGVAR